MESSLKNMVISLGVITLACSSAVGLVHGLTKEPIEAAKRAKTTHALAGVLPPFEGQPVVDTVRADGMQTIVYTAERDGKVVGYAVESATNRGFGGQIKLMTGFSPEGEILKIEVLQHNETPGLGDKIDSKKSDFSVQFQGKTPGKEFRMLVRKDGGDVDAITASTISSRAYMDAVQRAWDAFQRVKNGTAPPCDTNTGASTPQGKLQEPTSAPTEPDGKPVNASPPATTRAKPADTAKKAVPPVPVSKQAEPDANTGASAPQEEIKRVPDANTGATTQTDRRESRHE